MTDVARDCSLHRARLFTLKLARNFKRNASISIRFFFLLTVMSFVQIRHRCNEKRWESYKSQHEEFAEAEIEFGSILRGLHVRHAWSCYFSYGLVALFCKRKFVTRARDINTPLRMCRIQVPPRPIFTERKKAVSITISKREDLADERTRERGARTRVRVRARAKA